MIRIGKRRLELEALPRGVALDGAQYVVDVREGRDGVGVALASGDVAVRAGHGAPVGLRRGHEIAAAIERSTGQSFLDPEHQDRLLGLDRKSTRLNSSHANI